MSRYRYIGASVGTCAGIVGCEKAPDLVKEALQLQALWQKTIYFKGEKKRLSALDELTEFSTNLAQTTKEVIHNGHKFITIGGDHSCAIGTWSGVYEAIGDFGLIWIDAHMDAHTPKSSHSGNFHGMPVASLMGYGADKLTRILSNNPKAKPENIVLIGIRSFEEPEQILLQQLGVKVFMIEDVHQNGFQSCFQQALKYFEHNKLSFGISLDLDGLDPQYINALGTPVEDGIDLPDVLQAFENMPKSNFIGIEITEYNPALDDGNKGVEVIKAILQSVMGKSYFLADCLCEKGMLSV